MGLFKFSISNVPNGSTWLVAHAVFVFLVTCSTFYGLFRGYKDYAVLSSQYLRADNSHGSITRAAWRANEALQLRTVLIQNIPKNLRAGNGGRLAQWFSELGIGEVAEAVLDISADSQSTVATLLSTRTRALRSLEKAYVQWACNVETARLVLKLRRKGDRKSLKTTWLRAQLAWKGVLGSADGVSAFGISSRSLDEETAQNLRPKISWFLKHAHRSFDREELKNIGPSDDAIGYYTEKLNKLTALVRHERIAAFETENVAKDSLKASNRSAFVTFKTQRSAQ
ncbi:hypothetical protein HK100_001355, partial [Physocladia obscura]